MVRCLPKYLVISFLLIVLGLGFLWFGSRSTPQVSTPTPSVVESIPVATTSGVVGIEGERVKVTEVVDGDTIKIEGDITVRLLGIDTPETKDPRKSVQCFGKEASNEAKKLLSGKIVILEKDVSETDKYKRLLRYVYLPLENGPASRGEQLLFINDYLIREGFARALTYPPDVKYTQQFLEAQTEAKNNGRGLWGRC